MIQLKVRTEFHFDTSAKVFGKIDDVIARLKETETTAAAITDCTTFGHVRFFNAAKAAGIKPILGAQVMVTGIDTNRRHRMTLLAKNAAGLSELYSMVSLGDALDVEAMQASTSNVAKLAGTTADKRFLKSLKEAFVDIDPYDHELNREKLKVGLPVVLASDNFYPRAEDRNTFEMFGGSVRADPTQPQHIMTEAEMRGAFRYAPIVSALNNAAALAESCNVELPRATNIRAKGNLEEWCRAGILARGYTKKWTKAYEDRLTHELHLIKTKGFTDYFLVLSDVIRHAKSTMIVGPGRGSAAGSLVCFLTFITDVDPLQHGLIFERFIDVTRDDLPDIDVDFPDTKRDSVIEYLRKKYGKANVARIGTTQTWQPKSILIETSKQLNIPKWELDEVRETLIERNEGDARASLCLMDTLEQVESGVKLLKKYPVIKRAALWEGHAKYSGTHAAGVIICNDAVVNYCALNAEGVAHIDKRDAEKINILKLDLLGLRTLSVIEDCVSQIKRRTSLLNLPLNAPEPYALLNAGKFAGIFQFEGEEMQRLAKVMAGHIEKFEDIVTLGALARPGPLNSGGASSFAQRRIGKEPVQHLHKAIEPFTKETLGIIVFQEQVMQIARQVGRMDWPDVSKLRRIMGKSLGEETFEQYWLKFRDGSKLPEKAARHIWENMKTAGAYAFNKSHAVAYAYLSFWCAWLKARYPLEFAAATLRNLKSDDQGVQVLRELRDAGISYTAFDLDRSEINWSVKDGELIGGFLNIKGVGDVTAAEMIAERGNGGFSVKTLEKIADSEITFADVYPAESKFAHIYADPKASGFRLPKVSRIAEIGDAQSFAFIGLLRSKNPRDLNEYAFQVRRQAKGKRALITGYPTQYLNLILEDDTGKAYATINTRDFEAQGRDIVDNGVVDRTWYICQGKPSFIAGRIEITWAKELKS